MIQLPFWLIFSSHGGAFGEHDDGAPFVFRTAEQMAEFFQTDDREQWLVKHVTEASANAALDELEKLGFAEIRYIAADSSLPQKLTLSKVRQLLNLGKNGTR